MMTTSRWMLLGLLFPAVALAATPRAEDFAQGITLEASSGLPVLELPLPDAVYGGVTRTDLGDLQVFNAEGLPVSHALCREPEPAPPQIEQRELSLFVVNEPRSGNQAGTRVQVDTVGGTAIQVDEPGAAGAIGGAHVIEASGVGELRALSLDWSSPDGASEVRVQVLASTDLDRWQPLVTTTLLRAQQGALSLERQRIPLPQQSYTYLRLERADGGPPLEIRAATGEWVLPAPDSAPYWLVATPLAAPEELLFDSARIAAPVSLARVRLPGDNMASQLALESRPDAKAPWRTVWRGEVYSLNTLDAARQSPDLRFAATTDRYWRITPQAGSVLSSKLRPGLELAYLPARLRFLAQGAGPFLLAYGSRRAEPLPASPCHGLLGDLGSEELASLRGSVFALEPHQLGGDTALVPLPRPTPVRRIVLWVVLILATLMLVAMATSLLRRLRDPEGPEES